MGKSYYNKSFRSYDDQVKLLKKRGLEIADEEKALHLLRNISYYRFSGYLYPLLKNKKDHTFKEGASFAQAFNIYCFDRELRWLVLRELEKIEVSIRTKILHSYSEKEGPFWYLKLDLFREKKKHIDTLQIIKESHSKSNEEFINHFDKKYKDEFPPSWMIFEIVPFGSISMVYENLKNTPLKKEIADKYGLSRKVFTSWIHTLVYIRNLCAHHSRLWNKQFGIAPKKLKNPSESKVWLNNESVNNKKAYYFLSMVLYFLQTVNPHNQFARSFKNLLKKYPDIDYRAMGFPDHWEAEDIWES